jgi:hypothetical protein
MTDGADSGTNLFQTGVALVTLAPLAYMLTGWVALMLVGFVFAVIGL